MGPAAWPASSAPCWAVRPCWAGWFRWPGPPRRCAGRGWRSASRPGASSTAASTRCAATSTCSTLLIFSDEGAAGALRAARLAPLQRLRPAQQDRLAETLLAWLQHGCNANEVAQHVHVHPQTVRYRLRQVEDQVEDLFGDQLRDPDRRFELEIALRARHMLRRPGS